MLAPFMVAALQIVISSLSAASSIRFCRTAINSAAEKRGSSSRIRAVLKTNLNTSAFCCPRPPWIPQRCVFHSPYFPNYPTLPNSTGQGFLFFTHTLCHEPRSQKRSLQCPGPAIRGADRKWVAVGRSAAIAEAFWVLFTGTFINRFGTFVMPF